MELFLYVMKLCFKLVDMPFNLYGYTISFGNIIMLILVTGIVVAIYGGIFKT